MCVCVCVCAVWCKKNGGGKGGKEGRKEETRDREAGFVHIYKERGGVDHQKTTKKTKTQKKHNTTITHSRHAESIKGQRGGVGALLKNKHISDEGHLRIDFFPSFASSFLACVMLCYSPSDIVMITHTHTSHPHTHTHHTTPQHTHSSRGGTFISPAARVQKSSPETPTPTHKHPKHHITILSSPPLKQK